MPYKYKSVGMRRFMAGTGQRYTKSGKVRCQAVATFKAYISGRLYQNAEELWPEYQCGRAARPGYYVCWRHGAGKRNGPGPGVKAKVQATDISHHISKSIADKYVAFVEDPELFSQRKNVALLMARELQILENPELDLTGKQARNRLHRGLSLIKSGDVAAGSRVIEETLNGLDAASATWKEFRENAETIKNLTNAEINRAKEMRLTLTSEQVLGMIDRLLNVVTAAIEANVHDTAVQGKLMRTIVGETRGLIGTGAPTLLQPVGDEITAYRGESE